MRIDDTKKMGTFTQYNSDCGKTLTTSAYLFSMKRNTKDNWRMSEGCRMTSRGGPEDYQRISSGCLQGIQRGPKDLQRKDWGCIMMHTSA